MLLFSNDNYFIFGMNSILKDMNTPDNLERIVLFDRGNGIISAMTNSKLKNILKQNEPFIEFIQDEYLSINKNISASEVVKIPHLLSSHLKKTKNITSKLTTTERYILKTHFIENKGVHPPIINRKKIGHYRRIIFKKLNIKNNAELLILVNCWFFLIEKMGRIHLQ